MQNNSNKFEILTKFSGVLKVSVLTFTLATLALSIAGCSSKPKNDAAPGGSASPEVFQPDSHFAEGSQVVVAARAEIQLQYLESAGVTDLQMHDALSRNCASCHQHFTVLPQPEKYTLIQSRIASASRPMPPVGFGANTADRDLIQNWIGAQLNPAANSFEGYTVSAIDRSTFEVYAVETGTQGRFTVKFGDKAVASNLFLDLVVTGSDFVAQPIATIEITIDRTGVSYRNVTVASRDSAAPSVGSAVISASLVTQNSVTLTWAPATDNSPVEGLKYKVYQSSEAANFESASEMEQHGVRVGGDISGSVLELKINELTTASKYYFGVVVQDLEGNKTAYPKLEVMTAQAEICAAITAAGGLANWRDQQAASLTLNSFSEATVAANIKACFPAEVPKCVERINGYAIKDDVADAYLDGSFETLPQKQPPAELRDPENASGYWIPDNIEEIAAQKGWTTVRYRSRHAGGFDSDTPNLMMVYVPGDKVSPPVKFDRWLNFPLPRDYDDSASLESLDPSPTIGPPTRDAYQAPNNNFPSTFTMVTQDIDHSEPLVATRVYFQKFQRNSGGPTFIPEGIVDVESRCVSCHPNGLRAISPMGYTVRAGEKSLSKKNWDAVELINRKMIESANNLPPKWGEALVDGVSKPFYRADFRGPILGAMRPANAVSRTKEFILGGEIAGRQLSGCYKSREIRDIADIFSRTPGMGPNNWPALSPEALLPQPLATSVIDPQKVINAMNCEGCHVGGGAAARKRWPLNNFNDQVEFKILVDQSMPLGAHRDSFNETHSIGQSTDVLNADERMALANCLEAEFKEENTSANTLAWLKQEACSQ